MKSVFRLLLFTSIYSTLFLCQSQFTWADEEQDLIKVLQKEGESIPVLFEKAQAARRLAVVGTEDSVPILLDLLDNEKLDTEVCTALENIPAPGLKEKLREVLNDSEGRKKVNVVRILGNLKDAESVPILSTLISGDDKPVALAAIGALGSIGSGKAFNTLFTNVMNSEDEDFRVAGADAILKILDRLLHCGEDGNVLSWSILLQRHTKLPPGFKNAADRAVILASKEYGMEQLSEMLRSNDEHVFQNALGIAREIQCDAFPEKYADALKEIPPARQAFAMLVLADRQDVKSLPEPVLRLAREGSGEVRVAAFTVMGKHGTRECVPVLLESLTAGDNTLTEAAKSTLSRLEGKEIDDAIVKEIGNTNSTVRTTAINLIGQRGITAAGNRVFEIATTENESPPARSEAVTALGRIAGPELLAPMISAMDEAGTENEKTRWKNAIRDAAVRAPERDKCVQTLVNASEKGSLQTQLAVLETLPLIGGETALNTLAAKAKGRIPEIRDEATKSLGQWTGADAAPVLLDVTKTLKAQNDNRLHIRTLRGLNRVVRQFEMPRKDRLEFAQNARKIADREEEQNMFDEIIARWSVRSVNLFDGKTFDGWDGDMEKSFRIEDGAIVGGNLKNPIPRNEFLTAKNEYRNFVLKIECKAIGQGCNGGVQLRSRRIPDNHEMAGYQVDMDQSGAIWGNLYDESRRNRNLAVPQDRAAVMKVFKIDDWNSYEIRCEGKRVRVILNGLETIDYTEEDDTIEQVGRIGLQIHGGPPSETWYRNIEIEELD